MTPKYGFGPPENAQGQIQGLANPLGVCATCHTGKSSRYGKPNH